VFSYIPLRFGPPVAGKVNTSLDFGSPARAPARSNGKAAYGLGARELQERRY
jgi:hypothetical protein